ncbi:UNVERIFIED_CONTAM: hypothetical protein GTU68_050273 [Idotea baltica]|nr:hypothetical protein [Idotea baltica]
MIVSKNWLREYVSIDMPLDELTDRLTMSGLNLEGVESTADDTAVDLEVTSNRPDCLGHLGVAREISVLFESELTIPEANPATNSDNVVQQLSIEIQCPELCHEYHARLIQGVSVGPSPAWLVDRLKTAGISSVNNVVDVTNYVMLECSQPLHAFDADKVSGNRIVVRQSGKSETITAIDQKKYELPVGSCVIADDNGPLAIAGVMGGFDSEISDDTSNILIEAASFDPISVRSTSRTLKLQSPSSFRFERRVDRHNIDWASRRCCELILEVAGGQLLEGSVVAGDAPSAPAPVALRFAKVGQVLGIEVAADECVRILTGLGLSCTEQNETTASFVAPSFRLDLTRECDLIEEVARIFGYDRIPDNATLPVVSTQRTVREKVGDRVRNYLPACGFFEALTISFISEDQQQLFQPRGELKPVAVNHSTRSHENQLRQSLVPSLLQCRRQNERQGTPDAQLFEIAKVYLSAGEGKSENEAEPTMVSFVTGKDYLDAKGIVEGLVENVTGLTAIQVTPCSRPEFAAGRAADLTLNGTAFGWLGELDRSITDKLNLQDAVTVAELNFNVLEDLFLDTAEYVPVAKYPGISRDLNFVLKDEVTWASLHDAISVSGTDLLVEVSFSGEYKGQGIDDGHKSYLATCRFQSPDRTLKTEEVDGAVAGILKACEEKLSATLR